MLPFTYLEDSRTHYNEMLRAAEAERLANRFMKTHSTKTTNQLLLQVSNWLIGSGFWLKQRAEMRTSLG